MTDLLDDIDELLSKNEVAPKAAAPSVPTAECSECNASYAGTFRNAQLGAHRKSKHGVAGTSKDSSGKKRERAAKTTAPKTISKPGPKPVHRRVPLGESIARVVLQFGRIINAAVDPPTGAAIMFESGALGVAVDRAIAGTIIDRPLQKGVAVAERFEPLVPLVTLPLLVFMINRNPKIEGLIEGELREALEDVLVQSLPLLRKRAERTKATVDALAEMKIVDPSLANSEDPVGDILHGFFASPVPPPPETVNDGEPSPL